MAGALRRNRFDVTWERLSLTPALSRGEREAKSEGSDGGLRASR